MARKKDPSFDHLVDYIVGGNGTTLPRSWATTDLTVDLDVFESQPEMLAAARYALDVWSNSAGFTFAEVSSGADIRFSAEIGGAYTGTETRKDGEIIRADVNVSFDWMDDAPPDERWGVGDYGLMTFVHEIGHALGLRHPGPYNGFADYADDALFTKDTWGYSVMSYFEQENFRGRETYNVTSPMIADLAAIRELYGEIELRSGDSAYTYASMGLTGLEGTFVIADTGGRDAIDLRGSEGGEVDLREGRFSTLGAHADNVAVAYGTTIEDAYGSSFDDVLRGNAAANRLVGGAGSDRIVGDAGRDSLIGGAGQDTLSGGSGADRFVWRAAGDIDGDLVLDFGLGNDRLNFSATDADLTITGDQAFDFIGREAFSGAAGELRFDIRRGDTFVRGDVDGDGVADFSLTLTGRIDLQDADIML